MTDKEPVDLVSLLTDSLSLRNYGTPSTRSMFPNTPEDPYSDLIQQDPLQVLGERSFGQPKEISKNTIGTPIQEFFRGVNVLVTGGTGFIGKILIERLIRSIPHFGHVYLLIRAKRGMSSQERFQQLLDDQVFLRMRTEVPEWVSKITAVDGDISEPDLGLTAADRQMLSERVHVVFHSAADVRFIEPLRGAISCNVLGCKRVLDLAKEMKHLKSFVHVSTAYSQCVRRVIDETVPKMNMNYQEILNYIKSKTDEKLEEETARIMQGWPNPYTFSKAICEDMVQEEAKDLPICIFRPSVVMPTYKEPVRGWTDNLYGPTGLLVGAGLGILHCFRSNEELSTDTVPVDYVVNGMVAAAWRVGTCRESGVIPVYNFTSTPMKPMCWKALLSFALSHKESWPFTQAIWYTSAFSTDSNVVSEICYYLLHRIPGLFFDMLAQLSGGEPRLTKIYKRLQTFKVQTRYFICRTWEFKNDNVMDLWKMLDDEDKSIFYFDLRDVDLNEHFLVSKLGVRYYYLKEKMEDLPAARRKNTWLCWAHRSLKLVCSLAALKLMVLTAHALPL